MPFLDRILADAGYYLVAALGGMLGLATQKGDNKSIRRYLLSAVSAAFTGYVVISLCRAFNVGEDMIGALSGLAGWLGAENTMNILKRVAERRLGVQNEQSSKSVK